MYIGNYSAVGVGAASGVVAVGVVSVVPVATSVVGATSSTTGVVVSSAVGVVVSSVVAGLFMQPAKRATPATNTPRVSNFFMAPQFNYIKKYFYAAVVYKKIYYDYKSIIEIFSMTSF